MQKSTTIWQQMTTVRNIGRQPLRAAAALASSLRRC